jgi:hypothetical protein
MRNIQELTAGSTHHVLITTATSPLDEFIRARSDGIGIEVLTVMFTSTVSSK